MTLLFWILVGLIVYATIGYPLLALALAQLRPPRPVLEPTDPLAVDFVIPAHNESDVIAEKIRNTLVQSASVSHAIRILVVSDGSGDGTVDLARAEGGDAVEVIDIQPRQGKVNALNRAIDRLAGDIVVFSDANAMLVDGALGALLQHYGDPDVGGVCGAIRIEKAAKAGIASSEGLYWRYDQAVKAAESRLGGAVSAQGSFHSVRRAHVRPLPLDAADDFTLSVRAVSGGGRLVFEPAAIAVETVTEKAQKEITRRIRSTERGWRALMTHSHLLNPVRSGLYAVQLFSHKVLRRLVPFLMVALFVVNLALLGQGAFYQITFALQTLLYAAGLIGLLVPAARVLPGIRHAFFGLMALGAMALGLINYYRGKRSTIWAPVRDGAG
ncbi:MAG: glycosyltransferase family 2 protein [Pseudomonadota bacterium]